MVVCPLCKSEESIKIDDYYELPATNISKNLYNNKEVVFEWYKCCVCNLNYNHTESPDFVWRIQSRKSLKLKEPDSHIGSVSEMLKALAPDKYTFVNASYKDYALMQRLQEHGLSVDYNVWEEQDAEYLGRDAQINWHEGITKKINSIGKYSPVVLLLSKSIEHVFDPDIISALVESSDNLMYIYTETTFFQINDLATYSIWNERCCYYDLNHLSILFAKHGFKLQETFYGAMGGGFFALWKKVEFDMLKVPINLTTNQISRKPLTVQRSDSIFSDSIKIINQLTEDFCGRRIGVFGAGHKGVTLAQKLSKMNISCKLYDGNEANINKYSFLGVIGRGDAILSDNLDCILLAMSFSSAQRVASTLRKDGWEKPIVY